MNACRCMWRIEWFNFFLLVRWKTLVQLSVSLKQSHSHKHTEAHQSGNWFQMGLFHNGWAQLTDWLAPQCLTTWGTPTKRMSRIYFPWRNVHVRVHTHTYIHTHQPSLDNNAWMKNRNVGMEQSPHFSITSRCLLSPQKNSFVIGTVSPMYQNHKHRPFLISTGKALYILSLEPFHALSKSWYGLKQKFVFHFNTELVIHSVCVKN